MLKELSKSSIREIETKCKCILSGQIQYCADVVKLINPNYEFYDHVKINENGKDKEMTFGGESLVFIIINNNTAKRKEVLKIRRPDLTPIAKNRFERSVEIMVSLDNNRSFPTLYTSNKNPAYMTIEYIRGTDLRSYISQEERDIKDKISIWKSVALCIKILHNSKVAHRDIKPDNVIIRPSGEPCLIDFGIAKSYASKTVTRVGDPVGTPFYISPEQFYNASNVDWRTDIFALGKLLYFLLTEDDSIEQEEEKSISYKKIPKMFRSIISKSIAHDREDRHQTVKEMIEDLSQIEKRYFEKEKLLDTRHILKKIPENAPIKKDIIDHFGDLFLVNGGNLAKLNQMCGLTVNDGLILLSAARKRIFNSKNE